MFAASLPPCLSHSAYLRYWRSNSPNSSPSPRNLLGSLPLGRLVFGFGLGDRLSSELSDSFVCSCLRMLCTDFFCDRELLGVLPFSWVSSEDDVSLVCFLTLRLVCFSFGSWVQLCLLSSRSCVSFVRRCLSSFR